VNIGGLAATVIPWATNKRWPGEDDLRSFRVPLYVALAAPVLTLIAEVVLLVESPYWLMMKGRKEQARKALAFINPKSSEVDLDRAVAVLEYTLEKEAEANEQVIAGLFSDIERFKRSSAILVPLAAPKHDLPGLLQGSGSATNFLRRLPADLSEPYRSESGRHLCHL
jgi:hypothetical protein